MASGDEYNSDLDPYQVYYNWAVPLPQPTVTTNVIEGDTTIITTINGNSGQATGPAITLSGGSTGYEFNATAGTVTLTVDNAATARSSISAAKSGSNSDITDFAGLTGNGGWSAWTGSSDKTSHATYSDTADAAYNQTQIQTLMDKVQQLSEMNKALLDTLLGWGALES